MTGTRVRIVAVGDELLEGRTADTNSGRIQRAIGRHALPVAGVEVVPDRVAAIAAALARTDPGDVVFLTGGLGATPDDLTRDAVAAWAGVDLVLDEELCARQEERWRRRGYRNAEAVRCQSQLPAGLEPLENPLGSAPCLVGSLAGRTLVVLPGVPAEMSALLPAALAWLEDAGTLPAARPAHTWRTAQRSETAVVELCADIRSRYQDLEWSWWLSEWGVDVRLTAGVDTDPRVLAEAAVAVDRQLGPLVFGRGDASLPAVVQDLMVDRGATLAVAESCTGGLLGACLTEQPGSSAFFVGGVLAYAESVKETQLGVPASVLADHGAVSEETARAMVAGCRERLGADYGLAVTGLAGPGGGSEAKPRGTTWLALATPSRVFAARFHFRADRFRNRRLAVAAALDNLRRVLETGDEREPWLDADTWRAPR